MATNGRLKVQTRVSDRIDYRIIPFLITNQSRPFDAFMQCEGLSGQAEVPGNIFLDLARNQIIPSNLYGPDQDQLNRWIGLENWTYSRTFTSKTDAFLSMTFVISIEFVL
jgi:hypothetical protein